MTEIETAKLIAVIIELYPNFMKDRNIEPTVKVWHKVFANEPYHEMEAALYAFFSTDEKGFAPVPGNLRSILQNLRKPEGEMTETEAWALVQKATRNSIYNSEKEFAALPEAVQRCVGSAATLREWGIMDTDELNTVVASNFMRGFRARAGHVREMQKLPQSVREVFGLIGDVFRLPGEQPKPPAALPEAEAVEHDPKPAEPVTIDAKNVKPGEGQQYARAMVDEIRRKIAQNKMGGINND